MTPENVGGIALGDSATSPPVVLCPITRLDCTNGCVRECVSGNLRTPAPKARETLPYFVSEASYTAVMHAAAVLGDIATKLAHWDGSYREGLCAERCQRANESIRYALSGLDIFLGDEGAAAVLAPRKETR